MTGGFLFCLRSLGDDLVLRQKRLPPGCKLSAIQQKLCMDEASSSQTVGKLCFHSAQHAISLLEETHSE